MNHPVAFTLLNFLSSDKNRQISTNLDKSRQIWDDKVLFMLTSQRWSARPAWSSSSLERRWIAWCCCTESSRPGPPDPECIVRPEGRFRISRNCCSIWLRAGKRSVGGTCKIWWGRGCARSIRRWNGRLTNWEIGTGRVARLKARGKPIYLMLIGLSGSGSPPAFPNWTPNGVKQNSFFDFKTYLEYGLLWFLIVPLLVRSFTSRFYPASLERFVCRRLGYGVFERADAGVRG